MADGELSIPVFLDKVVDFSDGASYRLLRPLTTFRSCHDGVPAEGRIVFTCSRVDQGNQCSEEYIMKIKARYDDFKEKAQF